MLSKVTRKKIVEKLKRIYSTSTHKKKLLNMKMYQPTKKNTHTHTCQIQPVIHHFGWYVLLYKKKLQQMFLVLLRDECFSNDIFCIRMVCVCVCVYVVYMS